MAGVWAFVVLVVHSLQQSLQHSPRAWPVIPSAHHTLVSVSRLKPELLWTNTLRVERDTLVHRHRLHLLTR